MSTLTGVMQALVSFVEDDKNHLRLVVKLAIYIFKRFNMDLSPFRQNFEKNRNRQKYHHSLKEHPTFTKIAKFGCEML